MDNVDERELYIKEKEEKTNNLKKVKNTYSKIFYRELWINEKLAFAKEWLQNNDTQWINKHKDDRNINETFRNID